MPRIRFLSSPSPSLYLACSSSGGSMRIESGLGGLSKAAIISGDQFGGLGIVPSGGTGKGGNGWRGWYTPKTGLATT